MALIRRLRGFPCFNSGIAGLSPSIELYRQTPPILIPQYYRVIDLDWNAVDQILADRTSFPQLENLTITVQLFPSSLFHRTEIMAAFDEIKGAKLSRLSSAAKDLQVRAMLRMMMI